MEKPIPTIVSLDQTTDDRGTEAVMPIEHVIIVEGANSSIISPNTSQFDAFESLTEHNEMDVSTIDSLDQATDDRGTKAVMPIEKVIIVEGANSSIISPNTSKIDAFESLIEHNEMDISNASTQNVNTSIGSVEIDEKPMVPLYETHTRNDSHIIALLEKPIEMHCEILDDGLEMYFDKGMQFKPFAATPDGLTKRETPDNISGMIPFNESVCSIV